MLLQLGKTQPKATWTPPTEGTSAVAWFLSCNVAPPITGDVPLKFVLICFKLLSKGGKCLKIWIVFVKKEAEEHANANEGQQMR